MLSNTHDLWTKGMQAAFVVDVTDFLAIKSIDLMLCLEMASFMLIFCRLYFGDTKMFQLENAMSRSIYHRTWENLLSATLLLIQVVAIMGAAALQRTPRQDLIWFAVLLFANIIWLCCRTCRNNRLVADLLRSSKMKRDRNALLKLNSSMLIWILNNVVCVSVLAVLAFQLRGAMTCYIGFVVIIGSSVLDLWGTKNHYR